MRKKIYSIAVIEGDGIGKEVMPEGIRCLEAVSSKYGINLEFKNYDFSSVDYYEKHGAMLPEDWKEKLSSHDAIFLEQLDGRKRFQTTYHFGVLF